MIVLKREAYSIYISEKKDGTAREIKDFIYTKQVHWDNIALLEQPIDFIDSENDAIISQITDIKIGVLLADCNGIALMGKKWFGIVHAGRRWLQNNIVVKTIEKLKKLGEDINDIKVFVGPSIRSCCYEVGWEFTQYFDQKYLIPRGEKYHLDMIMYIQDSLDQANISRKNREIYPICTHCSDQFFSYRKGNDNQRIVVGIEKHTI